MGGAAKIKKRKKKQKKKTARGRFSIETSPAGGKTGGGHKGGGAKENQTQARVGLKVGLIT